MSEELRAGGLGDLRSGYARPIPWLQAFWAPRRDGKAVGAPALHLGRLPRGARGDALMLRKGFSATPF